MIDPKEIEELERLEREAQGKFDGSSPAVSYRMALHRAAPRLLEHVRELEAQAKEDEAVMKEHEHDIRWGEKCSVCLRLAARTKETNG